MVGREFLHATLHRIQRRRNKVTSERSGPAAVAIPNMIGVRPGLISAKNHILSRISYACDLPSSRLTNLRSPARFDPASGRIRRHIKVTLRHLDADRAVAIGAKKLAGQGGNCRFDFLLQSPSAATGDYNLWLAPFDERSRLAVWAAVMCQHHHVGLDWG